MASLHWTGNANALAQIEQIEADAPPGAGTTYTITINGKAITYTSLAGDTQADAVNGFVSAWNGSGEGETTEVTATNSGDTHVVFTATVPGVPFTIAASGTGWNVAGLTVVQGNSGPNVWGVLDNYEDETGAVPGAISSGDTIKVAGAVPDILYKLDTVVPATGELAKFYVDQSFSGSIGLRDNNPIGYREYRPRALLVNTLNLVIGRGNGAGSGFVRMDLNEKDTKIDVFQTGGPTDEDIKSVQITNVGALVGTAATLEVISGSVDVSRRQGEHSRFASVKVSGGDVRLLMGSTTASAAAEVNAMEITGGNVLVGATITANVICEGGTVAMNSESGTTGNVHILGPATVLYEGTTAIADLKLDHPTAVFSTGIGFNSFTVSDASYTRGRVEDVHQRITYTQLPTLGKIVNVSES